MKPHIWKDTGIRTHNAWNRKKKLIRFECSHCNSTLDVLVEDAKLARSDPKRFDEVAKSKKIDLDCDLVVVQSVMVQ